MMDLVKKFDDTELLILNGYCDSNSFKEIASLLKINAAAVVDEDIKETLINLFGKISAEAESDSDNSVFEEFKQYMPFVCASLSREDIVNEQ